MRIQHIDLLIVKTQLHILEAEVGLARLHNKKSAKEIDAIFEKTAKEIVESLGLRLPVETPEYIDTCTEYGEIPVNSTTTVSQDPF